MKMRRGSANPIRASGHRAPHKRPDTKLQPAQPPQQILPCLTGAVHTNVMFALKRARPSSRCVMGCHVLHAPGAYPAVLSGMRAAISGRCCGYSARVLRLCVFGIGISFRACFVRHSPPPACRSGGTLIRAYPARAPAPVGAQTAPARFARLIARARPGANRTQDATRLSAESGSFRTGPARAGSGPRMPLPSDPSYHNLSKYNPIIQKYCLNVMIIHGTRSGSSIFPVRTESPPRFGAGIQSSSDSPGLTRVKATGSEAETNSPSSRLTAV